VDHIAVVVVHMHPCHRLPAVPCRQYKPPSTPLPRQPRHRQRHALPPPLQHQPLLPCRQQVGACCQARQPQLQRRPLAAHHCCRCRRCHIIIAARAAAAAVGALVGGEGMAVAAAVAAVWESVVAVVAVVGMAPPVRRTLAAALSQRQRQQQGHTRRRRRTPPPRRRCPPMRRSQRSWRRSCAMARMTAQFVWTAWGGMRRSGRATPATACSTWHAPARGAKRAAR